MNLLLPGYMPLVPTVHALPATIRMELALQACSAPSVMTSKVRILQVSAMLASAPQVRHALMLHWSVTKIPVSVMNAKRPTIATLKSVTIQALVLFAQPKMLVPVTTHVTLPPQCA